MGNTEIRATCGHQDQIMRFREPSNTRQSKLAMAYHGVCCIYHFPEGAPDCFGVLPSYILILILCRSLYGLHYPKWIGELKTHPSSIISCSIVRLEWSRV